MEEAQVKKKRIRKKTCEIDSLEKLKSDTRTNATPEPVIEPKPRTRGKTKETKETKEVKETKNTKKETKNTKKETKTKKEEEDVNQSQISFGKFNITVKKKETMSAEELREYYDRKFKIEESEKTAKLMIQEDDTNAVFEPMMEDEVYVAKKDSKVEKIKAKIERTNVHRVLSKFIDGTKEEWPEKTDVLCWWCCHSFDTMPIPCPVEYDEIRDRYKVNGVFCSWACAAAHSVREYSNLSLIHQMKNDLCGYSENIVVAPPKYCLKNFGGYMTIKDFRSIDKTKTMLISTEGLSYINQEIAEMRS